MKSQLILLLTALYLLGTQDIIAQQKNQGHFSGNLELNANFFIRDSAIGAANTPQFDRQLYGAESWLQLNYSNFGFDIGLRYDLFNNSNLLNPQGGSFTGQGIGFWYIHKEVGKLGITAGYFYDQIGSGIIFRAYEQRPLLIDQAIYGARLTYEFGDNWKIKGFTGRQKQQFGEYDSIIKGFSVDGFVADTTGKWAIAPGFGVLNRTLDDESMSGLVAVLNTYEPEDVFVPKYNNYAFTLYNTLSSGPFTWYVEAAYKTEDAINDPFGEFITENDTVIGDKFINVTGSVLYTSFSYGDKGFGITLEGKRTENFSLRTNPQVRLNRGIINFLPPMFRVNTYRLTSRYSPATQELGEYAIQADLSYAPNRKWRFNANFSNITDLDGGLLYREVYGSVLYKYKRKWQLIAGVQHQEYNQEIYEFKPDVPIVNTITPFAEWLYKFSRKKSLRIEAQAMLIGDDKKAGTKQDYGNWIFGLAEFSIAPKWTFTISDMWNVTPGKLSPQDSDGNKLMKHFPRFDIFYVLKSNRFSLSYIKQVEGIVCAGGICRLEPAFSGVRFAVQSTF